MGNKVLISYSLSGRKNALEITRKIYGFNEFSNHSKYKYKRDGLLSGISYEKISKGCIMIDKNDEDTVVEGFVKLRLKIQVIEMKILNRK